MTPGASTEEATTSASSRRDNVLHSGRHTPEDPVRGFEDLTDCAEDVLKLPSSRRGSRIARKIAEPIIDAARAARDGRQHGQATASLEGKRGKAPSEMLLTSGNLTVNSCGR